MRGLRLTRRGEVVRDIAGGVLGTGVLYVWVLAMATMPI